MSTNCSPTSGIRYGVISANSLDPDVLNELFNGPGAVNVTEEAAYAEAKADAYRDYADLVEDAMMEAAESGADREVGFDRGEHEEEWFERNGHQIDEEMFVESALERFSENCQIEEPTYEGECEGVKYMLSCLGGAYNLWVIEGPVGFVDSLCSPCIPGAGDIQEGYRLEGEADENGDIDAGFECYVPPRDWLYVEVSA